MKTVIRSVLLFGLAACCVLEDRDRCPCRLRIDLSGIPESDITLFLSLPDGSWQDVCSLTLPLENELTRAVPKGTVDVMAVCPKPSGSPVGNGWEIPPGEDCPPVYLGAVRVDTDRETAACRVTVHKCYCRLRFRLAAESETEPFPFRLSVEGEVSGFSGSGAPREGLFRYVLPPFDVSGTASVCLPRQRDASLRLEILFSDNVLRTFALGQWLERSGYDWKKPDLDDVELELDYARTRLTVRTEAWEDCIYFEKVY